MISEDKKAEVNQLIAMKLFGWKWIAFIGCPVRGTEGYPENCKVRQFVSPELLANKKWKAFFESVGGFTDATGEEPLAYCYCSSRGPEFYDDFVQHFVECQKMMEHPNWPKVRDAVLSNTVGVES